MILMLVLYAYVTGAYWGEEEEEEAKLYIGASKLFQTHLWLSLFTVNSDLSFVQNYTIQLIWITQL